MEQDIQQLDEGSRPKASCVEVLSIREVKVAVKQLHMLFVIFSQLIDVARRPAFQQINVDLQSVI